MTGLMERQTGYHDEYVSSEDRVRMLMESADETVAFSERDQIQLGTD